MDSEKEDHRGHGMLSAGSPSQVDSAGHPPGVALLETTACGVARAARLE